MGQLTAFCRGPGPGCQQTTPPPQPPSRGKSSGCPKVRFLPWQPSNEGSASAPSAVFLAQGPGSAELTAGMERNTLHAPAPLRPLHPSCPAWGHRPGHPFPTSDCTLMLHSSSWTHSIEWVFWKMKGKPVVLHQSIHWGGQARGERPFRGGPPTLQRELVLPIHQKLGSFQKHRIPEAWTPPLKPPPTAIPQTTRLPPSLDAVMQRWLPCPAASILTAWPLPPGFTPLVGACTEPAGGPRPGLQPPPIQPSGKL